MNSLVCDTRSEVETPEGVLLSFDLAGPGSRMGAYLIDLALRLGILWALANFAGLMAIAVGSGAPLGFMLLSAFLMEWGYCALFEGFMRGQTPGKKLFNLRVITTAGTPIGFYSAVLRNFLRAADILPIGYGVGLISMGLTKRLQRIGDLVAGTIVVRTERVRFLRRSEIGNNSEPLERSECELSFHASERTLDLIERLLDRADQVGPRRLDEIAAYVAIPLAEQLGYELKTANNRTPHTNFLTRVLATFSDKSFTREQASRPSRPLDRQRTSATDVGNRDNRFESAERTATNNEPSLELEPATDPAVPQPPPPSRDPLIDGAQS